MASNTGSDANAQSAQKRPHDQEEGQTGNEKRAKTDPISYDSSLDNLFAPLPFETKDGFASSDFPIDSTAELDLPDFLSDRPPAIPESAQTYHQDGVSPPKNAVSETPTTSHTINSNVPAAYEQSASNIQALNNGQVSAQQTPNSQGISRANSSSRLPDQSQMGDVSTTPGPIPHSNSQSGIASTYQFQKTPATAFPNQYRPPTNAAASPSGFKSGIRFDPKKTFPMHGSQSSPMVPMAHSSLGTTNYTATPGAQDKNKPEDPSKLNDALAAAGVDIQREEELLSTNYNRSALSLHQQQMANRQRQTYGQLNAFLHPYHVALFMNRTARENGVVQNFMVDPEMLEFMSSACKEWLSDIVTKTVALARHRRRGIPAFNPKNKTAGKQKVSPPSQRSEVSKELRNLALRQKELEERRVAKRALLGLETSGEVAPDSGNKAGAEETLHRAANATAAMMTMNPSRKKYSWMTSTAGNAGDETKGSGAKDSGSKQSSLIASRGDNGLRFREIRTGNMISSKDLLGVLEDERIGTSKAIVKGYARLKD